MLYLLQQRSQRSPHPSTSERHFTFIGRRGVLPIIKLSIPCMPNIYPSPLHATCCASCGLDLDHPDGLSPSSLAANDHRCGSRSTARHQIIHPPPCYMLRWLLSAAPSSEHTLILRRLHCLLECLRSCDHVCLLLKMSVKLSHLTSLCCVQFCSYQNIDPLPHTAPP
jgi:hypothetical protein